MVASRFFRILIFLALPLAVCSTGSAASLQGKVSEVVDGQSFKLVSQTHTIKVKLLAIAAPEKSQSYSDAAKQHLSDLILNKVVMVRYSGVEDGYLVGQVACSEMDVNAQMIRDGVAWYNRSEASNLSSVEQGIYQASQDAARNERRGLWQDESPVSPWDYRTKVVTVTKPTPVLPAAQRSHLGRGTSAGLSSEDLMGGLIRPGAMAGRPEIKPLSANPASEHWLKYQPADRHFSILFPANGRQISYPVLDTQNKAMDLNYLMGTSDTSLYFLMWTKGATGSSTDDSTASDAINSFVDSINNASRHPGGIWVEAVPGRTLMLNGYAGRQYALTAGPVSGTVRILSKQINDEREVFILCVMNGIESEGTGAGFLNSFKVR